MMVMMLQLFTYIQMYCIFQIETEPMRGRPNLERYSFSYDAEMDG